MSRRKGQPKTPESFLPLKPRVFLMLLVLVQRGQTFFSIVIRAPSANATAR